MRFLLPSGPPLGPVLLWTFAAFLALAAAGMLVPAGDAPPTTLDKGLGPEVRTEPL